MALLAGLCAMACSQRPTPVSGVAVAGTTADAALAGVSICDRHVLKPEDAGGILSMPITGTKPFNGDDQSCELTTAAFAGIMVSVRPGVGRTTLDGWAAGKTPLESTPLAAVGDAAVWLQTLQEVIAQKNAILCDIQVVGGSSDIALDAAALPVAVGALCNKIFAAY